MKISCEIIRDILPLYAEDMVSQPTRDLVDDHLAECEGCTKELEALRKPQKLPVETDATSLKRVGESIRRRRVLAVMAVLLFVGTLLIGGALMLDATIYLSAEEAVKDIWIEGNTVRIRWENGITGTGSQYDAEYPDNYAVVAWTNLMNKLVPPQRIPYEALDEEVKAFITEEQYAAMDNTSTYEVTDPEKVNFWYYDMASGEATMLRDGGQLHPQQPLYQDSGHIRVYVYGLALLCALSMVGGMWLRSFWYGQLAIRLGILAGSAAISAVIVTAGQLVDIYGEFTEMIVDSSIVALPMALCGLCVMQLIQLNRKDKGL